jgi:hypothetical protein
LLIRIQSDQTFLLDPEPEFSPAEPDPALIIDS